MKQLLLFALSILVASTGFSQNCTPDLNYAASGPGVYPFSNAIRNCNDTIAYKTVIAVGDTTVTVTQPIEVTFTVDYDSSRIVSVSNLPPGLTLGTDVDGITDSNSPFGAWENDTTVNGDVIPAVGCVYIKGDAAAWDAAAANATNGIDTILVEYDFRVSKIDPSDLSIFVAPGTWYSQIDPIQGSNFVFSTVTFRVPIDFNPTDTLVPIVTGATSVTAGGTNNYITAAGFSTYDWVVTGGTIQSGQGTNIISVNWDGGVTTGNVEVTVGNGGMCTGTYGLDILNIEPNGIDELSTLNASVSPNPSNGQFTLQVDDTKPVSVEVFDLAGKQVFSANFNGSTTYVVDMEGARNGLYIMRLETSAGQAFQRLIKN